MLEEVLPISKPGTKAKRKAERRITIYDSSIHADTFARLYNDDSEPDSGAASANHSEASEQASFPSSPTPGITWDAEGLMVLPTVPLRDTTPALSPSPTFPPLHDLLAEEEANEKARITDSTSDIEDVTEAPYPLCVSLVVWMQVGCATFETTYIYSPSTCRTALAIATS